MHVESRFPRQDPGCLFGPSGIGATTFICTRPHCCTSCSKMTMATRYPAKAHAQKSAKFLKELDASLSSAAIYIAGEVLVLWPHCDQTKPLRQNRYFNYVSGAYDIPGCHVIYNIAQDELTLYIPDIDKEDVMWSGMPINEQEAAAKFEVDVVKRASHVEGDLQALFASGTRVVSTDKSERFAKVEVSATLLEAMDEARLTKDEYEIDLMRKAAAITDKSHLAVMSALPIEKNEGHIHAEFVYHCMRQGSKFQAYDPICCSGTSCGTLHYVKNDEDMDNRLLVLIDAGAEWQAYASDVTRVFPINGEWTKEALAIYETVREMQKQTMEKVRAGVSWDDLHKLSHKILVERLLELGIFNKEFSAEEIFESRVSTAFYPHGLGHVLGMDTHDCGGKPNYEDKDPMLQYLRLRRTLETHMVVTVEPGCYFNDFLLEPVLNDASKSKYINVDVLKQYMTVGGVRIEDDVLVLQDGFENLTQITKDPKEISDIVKKGIAKGRDGFHVVV